MLPIYGAEAEYDPGKFLIMQPNGITIGLLKSISGQWQASPDNSEVPVGTFDRREDAIKYLFDNA